VEVVDLRYDCALVAHKDVAPTDQDVEDIKTVVRPLMLVVAHEGLPILMHLNEIAVEKAEEESDTAIEEVRIEDPIEKLKC
jgi:hypothetical protein